MTLTLSLGFFLPENVSQLYSYSQHLACRVLSALCLLLLLKSNECKDVPDTLRPLCHAARAPCPRTAAPAIPWAAKERPCAFSASHEFCETAILFPCCLFFSFPRILTQSLREIEGSENNLKPYNLLYLKVPLFSERNSLSLESVYEPLYCFSQDTLCGSGRDTPYGYILPALRIAGHI